MLNGDGNSRLRQFELTAAASAGKESQIFLSYVHSYSVGNLNEFNTYLANFPPAVILPDARTYLPGDTPNRFLAWGTFAFPWKIPRDAQGGVPVRLPLVSSQRGSAICRGSRIRPAFPAFFLGGRPRHQRFQSHR